MRWPVTTIVILLWLASLAAAAAFAVRQPGRTPEATPDLAGDSEALREQIQALSARIAEIERDNAELARDLKAGPAAEEGGGPFEADSGADAPPSPAHALSHAEKQRLLDRNARILANLQNIEDLPDDGLLSLMALLADVARTGDEGFEQIADYFEERVLTGQSEDIEEAGMMLAIAIMGYPHERSLDMLSTLLESPSRFEYWEDEMGSVWAFHQLSRLPSADVRPYAAQMRQLGAGAISSGNPGEEALAPVAALAFVHNDPPSLSLMRHASVRGEGAATVLELADYLHTPAARQWVEDIGLTHSDPEVRRRAGEVMGRW